MRALKSLRFRLAFLFGLSLSLLAFLVLSILLNITENQLLDEIDSAMFENVQILDLYMEDLSHDLEHEDPDPIEIITFLEHETFELIKHSALQNEAYILCKDNETFIFNKTFSDELFALTPKQLQLIQYAEELQTINIANFPYSLRVLTIEIIDNYQLIIITSLENYQNQISHLRWSFASAAFALVIIGSFIAWFTLGKALEGVLLVTNAANSFASGNLKQRVSWQGQGSEIIDLVNHFNHMATQTEKLIFEMNEVTNNIAHDLRTPVTRMRGLAENILSKDPQNNLAAQVIEECERQAIIIEDILSLAESEAGVLSLNWVKTDLNEVLHDLVEIYTPLAENQCSSLNVETPDSPSNILIDPHRIQRVLANLMDNAIKYSPGSKIYLQLIEETDSFKIRLKDNGPGIPQNERQKVFERFYRGDESRSTNGSGLGLSLARAYVESHKGSLELENSSTGASFLISLPKT